MRDEEVLERLNQRKTGQSDPDRMSAHPDPAAVSGWLETARRHALASMDTLRLPFRKPMIEDLALFWPESPAHE